MYILTHVNFLLVQYILFGRSVLSYGQVWTKPICHLQFVNVIKYQYNEKNIEKHTIYVELNPFHVLVYLCLFRHQREHQTGVIHTNKSIILHIVRKYIKKNTIMII